jgi:Uncharacterized protein, possibly involved in utilization of glycolate and propanediol
MKLRIWTAVLLTTGLLAAGGANGQSTTPAGPNPLDAVPEKMPFSTPYGTPISLEKAQAVVQAAVAEANKHGWPLNVAVVDSGANLVTFVRMDGAQIGSIAISEHKARAAAKYRRPTKVFEEFMQQGRSYIGHARRCHRFARWNSAGRGQQDHRRDRLLRCNRLAGRGGVHGRAAPIK